MKSNKISIIIINNDSSSLEECIKSISNQTYDNYEILLACNSDNKEKLKKLSNKIKIYDNYFIMEDWDNDKFYKQFYTRDGDNVTLSGERIEVFAMLLTESEKLSIEEMRSNYAELKEFKENVEKNELLSKKEEILNSEKYAVLAQKDEEGKFINEAYAKLVSEIDNYSLADLETQIKVIHSDFVSEHSEFSASEVKKEKETVSKKQFANVQKKASKPSRYGKLFSK